VPDTGLHLGKFSLLYIEGWFSLFTLSIWKCTRWFHNISCGPRRQQDRVIPRWRVRKGRLGNNGRPRFTQS
jgi:hypothetical protein